MAHCNIVIERSSVWRTEAFVTKAGTNNEDIWSLWKKKG